MYSVWKVSYWWQTQGMWEACSSCGYAHCWSIPVEDEGTGKSQTCRFSPQLVLYLIWIRFCFGFWLVGWVCWFFYHPSCKLRLPVLLSDLHKHLMKKLRSFFLVLLCCPNIATIQQVKRDKKVEIIFIGQFCESLFGWCKHHSQCFTVLGNTGCQHRSRCVFVYSM